MTLPGKAAWALSGFLLLAPAGPLMAGINIGHSLDWLVVSRDHIAVARLVGTTGKSSPPALWTNRKLEFRVTKVLKGTPPPVAHFPRHVPVKDPSIAPGTEFLLFFSGEKADYAINLSSPSDRDYHNGLALSMDFQVLKTKKAILAAIDRRLKRLRRERPTGFHSLDIPDDTPAYRALWSGSACYLTVPAAHEFKALWLKDIRSKEALTRAAAAHRLGKYPGKDIAALLKSLLRDPGTSEIGLSRGNGTTERITVYPVREAAFKVLTSWGISVPKPKGYTGRSSAPFE